MMPRATRSQVQAITALLHQLRNDWDLAGIRAALAKVDPSTSGADLAVAACRVAADPDMRTPALIPQAGAHWAGTTAGRRQAPSMCPEHTDQRAGHCGGCVAASTPRPSWLVVPRPARPVDRTKPPDPPADLQQTRDRADREQDQP